MRDGIQEDADPRPDCPITLLYEDDRRGRLRTLDLLIAASVLAPALLFFLVGWLERGEALAAAEERLLSTLDALHGHAETAFTAQHVVLTAVGERLSGMDDAAIQGDEAAVHGYLHALSGGARRLLGIIVIGADGSPLADSHGLSAPRDYSLTDRAYFQHHAATPDDRVYVNAPIHSRRHGDVTVLSLSIRRNDPDGRFAGVAATSAPVDYFTGFWDAVSVDSPAFTMLLRADGAVLARSPDAGPAAALVPDDAIIRAIATHGERTIVPLRSAADGTALLFAWRRLSIAPLYIGHAVDRDAALAPWREDLAVFGALSVLASGALVLLALLARRRTARLADANHRLAGEVVERRVAEQRVRRLNVELERRVAERTAELERLNSELETRVAEGARQLVQAQKMEALGRLTSGIAHDFNNVLQGISSCVAVLEMRAGADPSKPVFETIGQGIDRGARLTQHLLAFSRNQTLSPEPTDVAVRIEELRPLLERSMGGLIDITIRVEPDAWPALVDPTQLELAILNLTINARDAMPDGGALSLRAANQTDPADLPPGDYVAITVSDTGVGMDAATLGRVVEPFFTTKPPGKGSGLGLSMVHGMAAQSGGGLVIASAPGRGAAVTILLPRAVPAGAEATPERPPAAPASAPAPPRTILLVDDDAIVRSGTAIGLERLGHRVIQAADGAEALRIVQEGAAVDAVVTDYAMPGMNGGELMQALRGVTPDLPILIATGYADPPAGLGKAPLIRKPFHPKELSARVAALAGVR